MRHSFYSRLLEEKEFLLEKKERIYVIIRSMLDALKNDPTWLNSREKKDFFVLAKGLLQDFALLEERRLVPAIDKLDHLLERLNTSIAELQLIGWSHAEKRLHLSFLTRLTSSFVLRKEAILKTVASLYLNARGTQQTDPDLDNKIFILAENIKLQQLHQISEELEQQSHLFVVILGTVIGAILALFIGYHINTSIMHFILLSILPICLAYFLRKVYIYTLTHS